MFVLTKSKGKEGRVELKSSSRSSNSREKTSVSANASALRPRNGEAGRGHRQPLRVPCQSSPCIYACLIRSFRRTAADGPVLKWRFLVTMIQVH